MDTTRKLRLVNSFIPRLLRRNARDHHRAGLRQIIIGGLAVKHLWLANDVEIFISTDGGKLGRPVQRRVSAKGFVIVE